MKTQKMLGPAVALLAAIWSLTVKTDEWGMKAWVHAPEAGVLAGPGENYEETVRVRRGHELTELGRIGPGRHTIFDDDFVELEVEIAEGDGEWVLVGIVGTGGKTGWVRASDIASAPPENTLAERAALLAAIAAADTAPCATKLYFTRVFPTGDIWYLKLPGATALLDVERWLGLSDETEWLLKTVQNLGDGADVPLAAVNRAVGEC